MAKRRVVIIGAGPGGLAAAMLLGKAGLDVIMLERLPEVGGRSRSLVANGFRFDCGPTFFLYPQVLKEIFEACDLRLEDEIDLVRLEPQYRLLFGDGSTIKVTSDHDQLRREIRCLAPADGDALDRFMADNRAKMAAFAPILQKPFTSYVDFLRPDVLRALPLLRPWQSVDDDLQRCFQDPRIRLAFSFQSKYVGMSPFQCPSLFTMLSYMEHEYGVFHPRGGCGAVVAKMASLATSMGVKIKLDEPVLKIHFEGRRAVGVETAKGTYHCDAMVINADFAQTMAKLVPNDLRRRWTNRRLAEKDYSCSTFMLYLGLRGRYDHLDHHTVYLAEDYARGIEQISAGESPDDPSFYVQNAGVTDGTLAPPGHSTLYVLAPVGNEQGKVDWSAAREPFRRRLLDGLRHIGLHDIEDRIVYEKVVTPRDWQQDLQIYRGATFNLAHNIGQMLLWRPHNAFEDLDGVYLVGGGTHPGSGLPVIFELARITTRLMAENFGFAMPEARGGVAIEPGSLADMKGNAA